MAMNSKMQQLLLSAARRHKQAQGPGPSAAKPVPPGMPAAAPTVGTRMNPGIVPMKTKR